VGWVLVGLGVAMVFWGFIANDEEGSDRSRWFITGGIVITVLAVVGMDLFG
jgi:hypothetical protein